MSFICVPSRKPLNVVGHLDRRFLKKTAWAPRAEMSTTWMSSWKAAGRGGLYCNFYLESSTRMLEGNPLEIVASALPPGPKKD